MENARFGSEAGLQFYVCRRAALGEHSGHRVRFRPELAKPLHIFANRLSGAAAPGDVPHGLDATGFQLIEPALDAAKKCFAEYLVAIIRFHGAVIPVMS